MYMPNNINDMDNLTLPALPEKALPVIDELVNILNIPRNTLAQND